MERRALRQFGAGVFTFLITAVAAFFIFAVGLVLTDFVALPLGVLVTAVIAANVASWAADRLAGDGMLTDINSVVTRNVMWALIPAAAVPLTVFFPGPPFPVFPVVVVYTVVVATALAFRYRVAASSARNRLGKTAAWLGGTAVFAGLVVFSASLFGLVGA